LYDDAAGANIVNTYSLALSGPGVEVTPVCPAQLTNTACNGGNIPGVTRFIYSANITLPHTSTGWRFRFNGIMGNQNQAGRSNNITNIQFVNNASLMNLEA